MSSLSRREALIGAAFTASGGLQSSFARGEGRSLPVLTPEMFGARGDGKTNDTAAFALLSKAAADEGAAHVVLRRATYIVGAQTRAEADAPTFAYQPSPILSFVALPGPIRIEGNGATLRCEEGLRYGTFDRLTEKPVEHGPSYYDRSKLAMPYQQMIRVERCSGAIEISDIELDGNCERLLLGGGFGDTGYQIPCSGILLITNGGDEILRNIHTHHHAQDGLIVTDRDDVLGKIRHGDQLRCEYNGRQGCSITAGNDWRFTRSRFANTGGAGISSAPGAGVDIEAESGRNSNLRFDQCDFVDNKGCGMVADSGDSEGAKFTRCRFVGTKSWSAWPRKPNFSFDACTFVGSVVNCFGDPDATRAAQFRDCLFTDDPRRSPTRKVYRAGKPHGALADLSSAENVRFDRCRFMAVAGAVLPWSTAAIYRDCTMHQMIHEACYPRGTFLGTNQIDCPTVGLVGSHVRGTLMLNGRKIVDQDL